MTAVVLFLSLFRIWLLLLVLDFFFGGGGFVDCVFWEWATVYALNSWVSWVNFCWVVVPIWVRVVVVGGFDLGLVCGLLRGLVLHLWFGL